MEKLIVDADGEIAIPSHIPEKRGVRPGDELTLVEAAEGLLIYQLGDDPMTTRWWSGLCEGERRQARAEAQHYEGLSEEEQDRVWEEEV